MADPDGAGRLLELAVRLEGDYAVAEWPTLTLWQMVAITP